jgi:alkylation response protein AidB-like acyl-CoA dehydrogenase
MLIVIHEHTCDQASHASVFPQPRRIGEAFMSVVTQPILSLQLLETLRSRAPGYDRDNRFFQEDFEDLRGAGDLQMAVPPEFGGLGLNLAESARETRRLAEYAPGLRSVSICTPIGSVWRLTFGAAVTNEFSLANRMMTVALLIQSGGHRSD